MVASKPLAWRKDKAILHPLGEMNLRSLGIDEAVGLQAGNGKVGVFFLSLIGAPCGRRENFDEEYRTILKVVLTGIAFADHADVGIVVAHLVGGLRPDLGIGINREAVATPKLRVEGGKGIARDVIVPLTGPRYRVNHASEIFVLFQRFILECEILAFGQKRLCLFSHGEDSSELLPGNQSVPSRGECSLGDVAFLQ